jgi:hypothetical protein
VQRRIAHGHCALLDADAVGVSEGSHTDACATSPPRDRHSAFLLYITVIIGHRRILLHRGLGNDRRLGCAGTLRDADRHTRRAARTVDEFDRRSLFETALVVAAVAGVIAAVLVITTSLGAIMIVTVTAVLWFAGLVALAVLAHG